MKVWQWLRKALRPLAIAVALAALIDPAITSDRIPRPVVALITDDLVADSAALHQVSDELKGSATVISAPFAAADAVIVFGDHLPAHIPEGTQPAFAITPAEAQRFLSLEQVDAPNWTTNLARVPVHLDIAAHHAKGATAVVTLSANDVVVDQQALSITDDDQRLHATMVFPPSAVGVTSLRVRATLESSGQPSDGDAVADLAVDVRSKKWRVFFFEPHASWLGTFVRRAAENDERFEVTSRTFTSRNISTDVGAPPATLEDVTALSSYDAIVVGAASALTAGDVAGLRKYLQQRGGSVVLLLDEHPKGPWENLTATNSWETYSGPAVSLPLIGEDSVTLRAGEMFWASRLPSGAIPLTLTTVGKISGTPGAVTWEFPVGSGRLIVSTSGDSWRYRDKQMSDFDQYWRTIVARAAAAAAEPLSIAISPNVLRLHEPGVVSVQVRSSALKTRQPNVSTFVTAQLVSAESGRLIKSIALLPDGTPGHFRASVSSDSAGAFRITAVSGSEVATAPLVVQTDARHARESNPGILAAWATTRRGSVLPVNRLDQLVPAIVAAVHPVARRESWHPMRNLWWLVVFTLALSLDWWLLRRSGAA